MKKFFNLKNIQKSLPIIVLIISIIVFTLIKVPYFDYNFSGEHEMKYSAYVEPAINMVEERDPFFYQQQYSANPIENDQGISEELPQLPILQWMLAGSFETFQDNSIEVNTRIVMHVIGIITLIFFFLSIKELSNNIIASISTLFLSTNSIFGLSTFVTVYDSFILMTLFISLYFLTLYIKQRSPLHFLTISAIIAGIGVSAKISLLVYLAPIVAILILFKSPSVKTKIFDSTIYIIFLIIPYIATTLAIPNISTQTNQSILIIISTIILSIFLGRILNIKKQNILKILENLHRKKYLIPGTIIIGIILLGFLIPIIISQAPTAEFLTDSKLIFNPYVYFEITKQFVRNITIPVALLSILGLFTLPFFKSRDIKIMTTSFLIAGIIFVIVASKSIFFHDYYTVFLMSASIILAGVGISFILQKYQNLPTYLLITVLIILFVLIPNTYQTQERISMQQEGLEEAVEYLKKNTEKGDYYIDEAQATYFSLYANRFRLDDISTLEDEQFKKDVQNLGFAEAMDKYGIKYLITFGDEPEYVRYANIFSDEDLKRPSYRRSDLILSRVQPDEHRYFEDKDLREEIIYEENLRKSFEFQKEFGNFRFFTFK